MKIISLKAALSSKEVVDTARSGGIIVYPTDTVYGIGCNIENSGSISKIIKAKNRDENEPFSIIIPSTDWIDQNCLITPENRNFLDSLFPGPYTAVVKLKPTVKLSISRDGTVGMRIPRNEFTDILRKENILFITTSVNVSGEDPIKQTSEIPDQIKQITDIIIDAGQIDGEPSRVFDLTKPNIEIIRY